MMQANLLSEVVAPTLPATPAGYNKHHYDAGESSEWYTPGKYIEPARATMGSIDLDPASCARANQTVKAATYFDRTADGLRQHWYGRVWLNPPYSDYRGQAAAWASKLLAEYQSGRVEQAVLLVNLSVAYQKAFQAIARVGAVCMVNERISFVSATGVQRDGPPQANMLLYLGERRRQFAAEFMESGLGVVLEVVRDDKVI